MGWHANCQWPSRPERAITETGWKSMLDTASLACVDNSSLPPAVIMGIVNCLPSHSSITRPCVSSPLLQVAIELLHLAGEQGLTSWAPGTTLNGKRFKLVSAACVLRHVNKCSEAKHHISALTIIATDFGHGWRK